jgi:drug/metabolite transporter (DMT)-like permease
MAAAASTRKKYTYAGVFLALSLVSFVVQTELSSVIQGDLGWNKAYCMMYFTHGSWVVLWPAQLLILRMQRRDVPWRTFWRRHVQLLRSTALMTQTQRLDVSRASASLARTGGLVFVVYIVRTIAMVTLALTVAGLSWYIAVDRTSPSDLTAIYNCNVFFAYAFSVPILRERLRLDKMAAVAIAIVGVVVVAYGDSGGGDDGNDSVDAREAAAALASRRFIGNVIIGIGSVLYGLYEVLYKRYACPPDGVSPYRGMLFATTVASCIGAFTLLVLWIPLPILHVTGIEPFRMPTGYTALLVVVAVLSNAVFSGSFLVLISLTSPVLSGVAALLTIFLVALADWFLKHKAISGAAIIGGLFIVVAFLMLCWSSYREMDEHAGRVPADMVDESEDGEEDGYDAESGGGEGSDVETEEVRGDHAALLRA